MTAASAFKKEDQMLKMIIFVDDRVVGAGIVTIMMIAAIEEIAIEEDIEGDYQNLSNIYLQSDIHYMGVSRTGQLYFYSKQSAIYW